MTPIQHLWWEQARSDYDVLMLMRNAGSPPCQQLHYLQMVTEKVGKAYLWRNDVSPGTSHAAFVSFLKSQADRPRQEAIRVASLLGFIHMKNYRAWLRKAIPLAYALQGMAPAGRRWSEPRVSLATKTSDRVSCAHPVRNLD